MFVCVCARLSVCVCVCVRSDRMPCHQSFLRQQGVPGAEQGWHQRRPLLLPVISISDARLTYLQRLCKVLLARCFPRCVCFMLNLVTFSPLEGNLVPCEPRLFILETFRLYSRLFSCTRKISILHLEFKCVCVCVSVWACSLFGWLIATINQWAGPFECSGCEANALTLLRRILPAFCHGLS